MTNKFDKNTFLEKSYKKTDKYPLKMTIKYDNRKDFGAGKGFVKTVILYNSKLKASFLFSFCNQE